MSIVSKVVGIDYMELLYINEVVCKRFINSSEDFDKPVRGVIKQLDLAKTE